MVIIIIFIIVIIVIIISSSLGVINLPNRVRAQQVVLSRLLLWSSSSSSASLLSRRRQRSASCLITIMVVMVTIIIGVVIIITSSSSAVVKVSCRVRAQQVVLCCSIQVSQKFLQHCLWNSSKADVIARRCPFGSFQRRSWSASSFSACLLQAIDGNVCGWLYLSPRPILGRRKTGASSSLQKLRRWKG